MQSTDLAQRLGIVLQERGLTLATAESCTGGALATAITAIAGASHYFRGGAIVYSTASKARVLGVANEVIAAEGVVSEACAFAMAQGARQLFDADIAIATTGIAGPAGAEPGKPVGTVHVAVACANRTRHLHRVYDGDRAAVIAAATGDALRLTLDILQVRL